MFGIRESDFVAYTRFPDQGSDRAQVAPPSVVSATVPSRSRSQPWSGETHVAEAAAAGRDIGAVVVVVCVFVGFAVVPS